MRLRLLIILLATTLQCHILTQDIRFHPDEAFFMTFARNASVNGDWMLAGSLDKPPLSIYTSAVSMMFVGVTVDDGGVLQLDAHMGEFAGRLPNALYAILLVALIMRLAHDLYRQKWVTLFSGLLMATSPYLLGFGATAFTDMSLLFWGTLSLWLTVRGCYGWAGVALGLAFWSKQQAVFFLPMVVLMMLFIRVPTPNPSPRCKEGLLSLPIRSGGRFTGGIVLLTCLLVLFLWDNARPDTSIFILGTVNNTPDSLIAPLSDYLPRLAEWGRLGVWLLSQPILTVLMIGTALVSWVWMWRKGDTHRWTDTLLWGYILAYIGLHTVLAFNQYDRYLLVILPMVVLVCARGLANLMDVLCRDKACLVPTVGADLSSAPTVLIICLILISTLITLTNPLPIGGDDGTYNGVDALAEYLNSKPVATVIYDRWLGWELGYYMGQWTNKRRVYFPTPDALVDGALALDEVGDRYLVAPNDKPVAVWLDALREVGFAIELDYAQDNFRVYRLSVPASDA